MMRLTKLETEKLEKIRDEVQYRFRRRKGPTHVRPKPLNPAAWCEWMVKATAKDIGIPWKVSLAKGSVPAIRAEMFRAQKDRLNQLRGITYGLIISQYMARRYASYVCQPEPLGRGTVPTSDCVLSPTPGFGKTTSLMTIKVVGAKPAVDVERPQLLLMDEVSS